MGIFQKPLVVLGLLVAVAFVAVYVFVDDTRMPAGGDGVQVKSPRADARDGNARTPKRARTDGDDFDGLAVFPTWSTLEPATFPILIDGQARGQWFFEGSFPVKVMLPGGVVLGEGVAQAQSDWMTTDVVPFYAEIKRAENAPEYSGVAALVLEKANPSGLPENAARFTTQIVVDTTSR